MINSPGCFAPLWSERRKGKHMRKRMLLRSLVPLLIGAVGISNVASKARFATYVTVDVVTLIASGMCLGAALTMLVQAGKRV
jgi:hypothetical protein